MTVTDANLCTATASATVAEPLDAITATALAADADCFGSATGSVTLTVSGGTAPYTYLWSNGATTQDLTDVIAGTYSVTVTDATSVQRPLRLLSLSPWMLLRLRLLLLTLTASVLLPAHVTLTVSGGTAPYTYLWSNGATTQDLTM